MSFFRFHFISLRRRLSLPTLPTPIARFYFFRIFIASVGFLVKHHTVVILIWPSLWCCRVECELKHMGIHRYLNASTEVNLAIMTVYVILWHELIAVEGKWQESVYNGAVVPYTWSRCSSGSDSCYFSASIVCCVVASQHLYACGWWVVIDKGEIFSPGLIVIVWFMVLILFQFNWFYLEKK